MVTIITDRIGFSAEASFRDLKTWWEIRRGDLVGSGLRVIAELEPQGWHSSLNPILTMVPDPGIITDSTHYYHIRTIEDNKFNGNFNHLHSIPHLSSTQAPVVTIGIPYTRVEHFIIQNSGGAFFSGDGGEIITTFGNNMGRNIIVDSLGFYQLNRSTTVHPSGFRTSTFVAISSGVDFRNCVVLDNQAKANSDSDDVSIIRAIGVIVDAQNPTGVGVNFYNNTIGNTTALHTRIAVKDKFTIADAVGVIVDGAPNNFVKNNYVYGTLATELDTSFSKLGFESGYFGHDSATKAVFAHNFSEDNSADSILVLEDMRETSGNRSLIDPLLHMQDKDTNVHIFIDSILATSGVPFRVNDGFTHDIDGNLRGSFIGGSYSPFPWAIGVDSPPSGIDLQTGVPLHTVGTEPDLVSISGIDLFTRSQNEASNRHYDIFDRGIIGSDYNIVQGSWGISNNQLISTTENYNDTIQLSRGRPNKWMEVDVEFEKLRDTGPDTFTAAYFPKYIDADNFVLLGMTLFTTQVSLFEVSNGTLDSLTTFTASNLPFDPITNRARLKALMVGSGITTFLNDEELGTIYFEGSGLHAAEPALTIITPQTQTTVAVNTFTVKEPQLPLYLHATQVLTDTIPLVLTNAVIANSIADGIRFYFEDFE